jgi:hypothetical protein
MLHGAEKHLPAPTVYVHKLAEMPILVCIAHAHTHYLLRWAHKLFHYCSRYGHLIIREASMDSRRLQQIAKQNEHATNPALLHTQQLTATYESRSRVDWESVRPQTVL